MFIYRIRFDLACKFKVEHVDFYVKNYLQRIVATGCFSSYALEMDVNKNTVVISKYCKNMDIYQKYVQSYESDIMQSVDNVIGDALLKSEKTFTKVLLANSNW